VSRDGRNTPIPIEPDLYSYPRLSPDGRRLAVGIERDGRDVWLIDLERLTRIRVTADRGVDPPPPITAWTPDGRRLAFNRRARSPETTLEWIDPAADEQPAVLTRQPTLVAGMSFARGGATMVFFRFENDTSRDLWVTEGDTAPRPLLVTPANERAPQLSPDGRWIAYVANPTGRDEVYLRPFPEGGREMVVSTGGGAEPVWSRDGRQLFYREGDGLWSVSVQSGPRPILGRPQLLFEGPYYREAVGVANYDVAADGRFVMISTAPRPPGRLTVVHNWLTELEPAGRP
jgi:serine/threonine-protein kinase